MSCSPSTHAGRSSASLAAGDVRPADPAVDPEQLDAVRLAAQDALTLAGHTQLESHERLAVAQRRRRGQRRAVALDEPVLALSERRQRAEEPRVAEEWSVLAPLCRDECCRGSSRSGRDSLECGSLGSRQAVAGGGQFLKQAPEGRPEERQVRIVARRQLGEIGRASCRERV